MTEPTVTQTVKALIARHGTIELAVAFLRHYWQAIGIIGGALIAFGLFMAQFEAVKHNGERILAGMAVLSEQQAVLRSEVTAIKSDVTAVRDKQGAIETHWNALFDAAHIVVTPNTPPPPPPNAPQKREGTIHR